MFNRHTHKFYTIYNHEERAQSCLYLSDNCTCTKIYRTSKGIRINSCPLGNKGAVLKVPNVRHKTNSVCKLDYFSLLHNCVLHHLIS